MEDQSVIELNAVDKRFGPTPILQQATLSVPRGQTCGIVGVNGSGKTTLLRCLVGLIRPNAGRVALLGQEIYPRLGALPRGVGAVIEQPAFLGSLTGWRNLELLASLVPTGVRRVAVTAGSSTPSPITRAVIQQLEAWGVEANHAR